METGVNRPPTEPFAFSNRHLDLAARDEEAVIGWRYAPRIVFSAGRGAKLIDVDGNEYYDCNAGMMCSCSAMRTPSSSRPSRSRRSASFTQSSWYSNPWAIELAELVASTLPGDLDVTNYAVTGSEANEIAMRMALGVTGGFDICTVVGACTGAPSARSRRRRWAGRASAASAR